jgi:hypothetical protein
MAILLFMFSMALASGALLTFRCCQPLPCLRRLQHSTEKRIFVMAITSRGKGGP